jgi:hypothetical protein
MRRISFLLLVTAVAVFCGCAAPGSKDNVAACREWLQQHPVYKVAKAASGKPITQDTLRIFANLEKAGLVWVKSSGTKFNFKTSIGIPEIQLILGVTLEFEGKERYQFNFPIDPEILTIFHLTKLHTGDNFEKLYAIDWLSTCSNPVIVEGNAEYLRSVVLPALQEEGGQKFEFHVLTNKSVRNNIAQLAAELDLRGFAGVVSELAEEVRQVLKAAKEGQENYWNWKLLLERLEKYLNPAEDKPK